ncbi:hypothetical protein BC440_13260 [Thalassospira sp. MIT1004]|nr:hypothetical protein BC440_13260 [Thalassospira sp. MIT1004]|tara:strand:- start:244 stop:444 length:201 start_codon:yes stop_codon:yes gene_type:complete
MQIEPKYAFGLHSALAGSGFIRMAAVPKAIATMKDRRAEIIIVFSFVLRAAKYGAIQCRDQYGLGG